MNHAITLGGLLSTLLALGGLATLGFGGLMVFAGGMSDAPEAGESASSQGCVVFVIGALMLGVGLWGMLR